MSTTLQQPPCSAELVAPALDVVDVTTPPEIPDALRAAGWSPWMLSWHLAMQHVHEVGYCAAWRALDAAHLALLRVVRQPDGSLRVDWSVHAALEALPDLPDDAAGSRTVLWVRAYELAQKIRGWLAGELAREACMDSVRFPGTSHAQPEAVRDRAYRRAMGGAR